MYRTSFSRQDDQKLLFDFIKEHPFATLITPGDMFPQATLIPVELIEEEEPYILGHVSGANPQGKSFGINTPALIVCTAGHTYVSSSWYEKENVSTWNYRSVQVKGMISLLEGDDLWNHLKRMQANYEKGRDNARTVDTMSEGYFEKQVKAVKGFKLKIHSIEGSWKLSQNRNENDFKNIIQHLEKNEDAQSKEVAAEMKKLSKD